VTRGYSMFSNVSDEGLRDLQPVESLVQLQDFLERLASLELAFRPLLRSDSLQSDQSLGRAVAQYRLSVFRACEALLSGRSQEERQVFKPRGLS